MDTQAFEKFRTLSFFPPDGEFNVLNYRVISNYNKPFTLFCFVEKQGKYKGELIVKVMVK
jgi:AP-4 complex subunit mu-1